VLFLTRSAYSHSDSPAQTEASFQPPSVSIEEIVVVSQQTFQRLRTQLDLAEVALSAAYNDLNDLDEFDVSCKKSDWAGTHIQQQMCWPQFMTELSAQNAQDWRFDIGMLVPVDQLQFNNGDKFDDLRENIRVVALEHSDAAAALLEVGKLQVAMRRKREACMQQKPFLFVFRLCK
jgi:hypothetical protein